MAPVPKTTFAVLALALALADASAGVDARPEPGIDMCPTYNLDQKYYWNWGEPIPNSGGECTFPYDQSPTGDPFNRDLGILVVAAPKSIVTGNLTVKTELIRGSVKYDLFLNEFDYYVIVFKYEFTWPVLFRTEVQVTWYIDDRRVASGTYKLYRSTFQGDDFTTSAADLSVGHRVDLFNGSAHEAHGPAVGHVAVVQFS